MSAGMPFWRKQTFWFGLAGLGPVAALYVAMSFWPILRAFWISLQFFNPLNPELTKFAGLDQYRDAFTSPRFQRVLVNTWQYMLTKNAVAVPVGLLLTLLLDRVRSRQAYLFAYFLPGVMSVVGIAVLFRWLYDPTVGPLDGLLRSVGLPAQSFIRSEAQALPSVAAMDAWRSFGFYTILFLAGLMNIPESIHDAAKMDGAVGWRSLRYILLPLLAPAVLLVVRGRGRATSEESEPGGKSEVFAKLPRQRELLVQVAPRYSGARQGHRTAILDEFVAVTGYDRKYAIRLLLGPIRPPGPIQRLLSFHRRRLIVHSNQSAKAGQRHSGQL